MKRSKGLFAGLALVGIIMMGTGGLLAQDEPLRITYVVNGVLGDQSFFDSAQRGMDRVMDEFDAEVETVELGIDPANWEAGLDDVISDTDSYDILITGTYNMLEFLATRAHLYPEKTFIFYDEPIPYDDEALCVEGCTNVYSVTYLQNEGSFLAGVYAAAMAMQGFEDMTQETPILGAVGGQDIPIIADFIVGYEQGACLVNADTEVLVQFADSWFDPARGKEIALALYERDASIVFQIAGGTGVGVFEAAEEAGRYAIGVDSDQAAAIVETDPAQAGRILTSMLKNIDNSLFRAVELYLADELPVGTTEALGIAEEGVGLAYNDIYTEATPDNVQELLAAVQESIIAGDITVNSVFTEENPATVGMGCDAMGETEFDAALFLGDS